MSRLNDGVVEQYRTRRHAPDCSFKEKTTEYAISRKPNGDICFVQKFHFYGVKDKIPYSCFEWHEVPEVDWAEVKK
jgi:hypothetical protein